ncbi:hypothetical protein V6Z11_A08G296100 [Gossypium hirsutum]
MSNIKNNILIIWLVQTVITCTTILAVDPCCKALTITANHNKQQNSTDVPNIFTFFKHPLSIWSMMFQTSSKYMKKT